MSSEKCFKDLLVVVGVDVRVGLVGADGTNHRVIAVWKLDDEVGVHTSKPTEVIGHWNVASDNDVVHHGESQNQIRLCPFDDIGTFLAAKA